MASQPAQAFLSYAHNDDAYLNGGITWLREELQRAVHGRTGKSFSIFMDKHGIDWGQHFPSRLDEALEEARFFIPFFRHATSRAPFAGKRPSSFSTSKTRPAGEI